MIQTPGPVITPCLQGHLNIEYLWNSALYRQKHSTRLAHVIDLGRTRYRVFLSWPAELQVKSQLRTVASSGGGRSTDARPQDYLSVLYGLASAWTQTASISPTTEAVVTLVSLTFAGLKKTVE